MILSNKFLKNTLATSYLGLVAGFMGYNSGCSVIRPEKEKNHHLVYEAFQEKNFRVVAYDFNENGVPELIMQWRHSNKGKSADELSDPYWEFEYYFHDWNEDGIPDSRTDKDGGLVLYFSKSPIENYGSLKNKSTSLQYNGGNFLLDSFKNNLSKSSPDSVVNNSKKP